jgi:hypothetical protein
MEQKNRNIWIAVAVIVVVLCCCAAAVTAVAAGLIVDRVQKVSTDLQIFDFDTGNGASAQVEQVFETGQAPVLDVSNFAGSVNIRPGEGNTVRVVATKWALRSSALDGISVSMTEEQDQITVRTKKANNLGNAHVELEIVAPLRSEIRLVTGAGTIDLHGMTGSIDAHTGAGEVVVAGASGSVRLGVGAGRIQYQGAPAGYCSFEIGAGEILLRLPADPDVRVDLGVGFGSIDVGFDVDGSRSARQVTGVIGDGSQATIYAHSGVGVISVLP